MKITDVIIDAHATLGSQVWLTDVKPCYAYDGGTRTDRIEGYRYTVASIDRGLEKVDIKIMGTQRMDKPAKYQLVIIDGLEMTIYWMRGDYAIKATATDIRSAKPDNLSQQSHHPQQNPQINK